MQIHPHIDAQVRQQLEYLQDATGQNLDDVLRASVAHYYTQVRAQRGGLKHFVAYIGKGHSGHSHIASQYKEQLACSLENKYQNRKQENSEGRV